MDLNSCEKCGVVMDMNKVKFIHMEIPDDPKDEEKRDEDGYLPFDVDSIYSDDIVWGNDHDPLETWQCPICKAFNGKGEK